MNRFNLLGLLFVVCVHLFPAQAQTDSVPAFSLAQAQAYALEHNYEYLSKEKDVLIAKKKVWETTAIGLPQINAEGQFNNFLDIPTTVVPANTFNPLAPADQLVGLKFGTDYKTTAGVNVSQLIFDGSYIVGLQAARTYKALSEIQKQKTEQEVKEDVAQAYYTVVLAQENLTVLDSSFFYIKKLLNDTRKFYEQGLVEEQNVDQLQLTLQTIESTLKNARNQYSLAEKMLKYTIGYPVNSPLTLSDGKETFMSNIIPQDSVAFNPQVTFDLQLARTNEHLMKLNLRKEKYSFFPSIAAFFSHQQQNFGNTFDAFSGGTYYPATLWGISVKLPVFTSGMRLAKIGQAKLNYEKAQLQSIQAEEALWLKYQQLTIEVKNAYNTYLLEKNNLQLADKIQRNTTKKYRLGLASSLELTQTQNQYLSVEARYIQSLMNLLIKKSELNKLLNQ